MAKKYFIDCGGHRGESVRYAKHNWPEIEVHTFEPFPALWSNFDDLPTTLHKQAVWIFDGEVTLYTGTRPMSNTIIRGRTCHSQRFYEESIKVPCIDLGKWIKENFKKEDYIILKLNVECAEYEILKHMFEDRSIQYINQIYGHLHSSKYDTYTEKDDLELFNKLKNYDLEWQTWYPKI